MHQDGKMTSEKPKLNQTKRNTSILKTLLTQGHKLDAKTFGTLKINLNRMALSKPKLWAYTNIEPLRVNECTCQWQSTAAVGHTDLAALPY